MITEMNGSISKYFPDFIILVYALDIIMYSFNVP